jgi:hypothetical protein
MQLIVRQRPSNAGATLEWSSDNTSVATVDQSTGVGTANTIASKGSVSAKFVITGEYRSITITASSDAKFEVDDQVQLTVITDPFVNNPSLTWASADESIA